MEDTKQIKIMFSVSVTSIISDTEDKAKGEAQTGYQYTFDTSLPELAYALAGFLKVIDDDPNIKQTIDGTRSVGDAFIALLQQDYNTIK